MLKLNYNIAIKLVVILIILSIFTSIISNFFYYFLHLRIPINLLFPILYITPFILFFYFMYYNNKNMILNFSNFLSEWQIYPLIIIITLCGIIITNYISLIIPHDYALLEPIYKKMEQIIDVQSKYPISLIISTVIFAPICEEVFFRGILLNGLLNNNINPIKAIIFSSFLFGIIHMNPWQFIGGMIMGSIFGIIYFYTKSIFNCILLHSFNNMLAITSILSKYETHQKMILDVNIWTCILSFIIILISINALIHQTKKNKKISYF